MLPGFEGLRVEWWLGKISQCCTRVLRLWWSGPGNYIRGTIRALFSPLWLWLFVNSITLTVPHASLPSKYREEPRKPYQTSSQGQEPLCDLPFIMPCVVCQTRKEYVWCDGGIDPSTCTLTCLCWEYLFTAYWRLWFRRSNWLEIGYCRWDALRLKCQLTAQDSSLMVKIRNGLKRKECLKPEQVIKCCIANKIQCSKRNWDYFNPLADFIILPERERER